MNRSLRQFLAVLLVVTFALWAGAAARGDNPAKSEKPAPKGQRIFICGHSFHMPVGGMLPEIVRSAGITDQPPVSEQRMAGSTVTQHWNLAEEQNTLKKALRAAQVDVLTLSPTAQLPDDGIDKFTELGMEHNPNIRVLVQASWVGFDSPANDPRKFKNEQRDVAKPDDLRKVYDPFYKIMGDQVRKLNEKYKAKNPQVAYVVPVAYAIITLRQKVAEGTAPGIAKQSELFRDDRGHGKLAIYLLATYCNYAVIYGRSPVGLPAPASLKKDIKAADVEKLNRLLEEIAWDAVTNEPLTGVKK